MSLPVHSVSHYMFFLAGDYLNRWLSSAFIALSGKLFYFGMDIKKHGKRFNCFFLFVIFAKS